LEALLHSKQWRSVGPKSKAEEYCSTWEGERYTGTEATEAGMSFTMIKALLHQKAIETGMYDLFKVETAGKGTLNLFEKHALLTEEEVKSHCDAATSQGWRPMD
jgi:hypothetical protein